MEEKNNKSVSSGVTISGLLGVAFIILKLCKVISWSWLWVLAPFWIPAGIGLLVLIVYLISVLVTIISIKRFFK
jgi:hypothetical protein